MNLNLDQYGFIVQKDGDGGDTAQREGMVGIAAALTNDVVWTERTKKKIAELELCATGLFRRHPYQWNETSDFSRDQQTPIVIAMGFLGMIEQLDRMFSATVDRYFRCQNADINSPEHIGHFLRSKPKLWFWFFLLFSDIFMLLNSIILCFKGLDKNNVGDDLNHVCSLIQARLRLPTPVSFMARKIYAWFRPGGPQRAFDHYFRPETGANPINEIYRPLIQKYILD